MEERLKPDEDSQLLVLSWAAQCFFKNLDKVIGSSTSYLYVVLGRAKIMFLVIIKPWSSIISLTHQTYITFVTDLGSIRKFKSNLFRYVRLVKISFLFKQLIRLTHKDSCQFTYYFPCFMYTILQHNILIKENSKLQYKYMKQPCICQSFSAIVYAEFKYVT